MVQKSLHDGICESISEGGGQRPSIGDKSLESASLCFHVINYLFPLSHLAANFSVGTDVHSIRFISDGQYRFVP